MHSKCPIKLHVPSFKLSGVLTQRESSYSSGMYLRPKSFPNSNSLEGKIYFYIYKTHQQPSFSLKILKLIVNSQQTNQSWVHVFFSTILFYPKSYSLYKKSCASLACIGTNTTKDMVPYFFLLWSILKHWVLLQQSHTNKPKL